jgi:hypothetical protein
MLLTRIYCLWRLRRNKKKLAFLRESYIHWRNMAVFSKDPNLGFLNCFHMSAACTAYDRLWMKTTGHKTDSLGRCKKYIKEH